MEVSGQPPQVKKRPYPRFAELILFEDEWLLCINKPTGITSLQERNLPGTGLLELARVYDPTLKLCHRLDRNTTGVLLFAKGDEAYRNIALQFEHRQVQKHYLALVRGVVQWQGQVVELPLGPVVKGAVRVDFHGGKEAITVCSTAQAYRHYTLLHCMPFTGRSHQIRVHLAFIKYPIVGDELYGGQPLVLSELKRSYKLGRELEQERGLNDGYVLHAHRLVVTHPSTQAPQEFVAAYSPNLQVCLKVLDKYDKP